MTTPFPYLDLLPELRCTIARSLPRRTRVALQRACSTTHADDPGSFTPLEMPPVTLSPAFRAFALRVFAEVIDAGLDLRQPLCTVTCYEVAKQLQFAWDEGTHDGSPCGDSLVASLRVRDHLSQIDHVLPTRAGLSNFGRWPVEEMKRPAHAVAEWDAQRAIPDTRYVHAHRVFFGVAWHLAWLEPHVPWIGIFERVEEVS